MAQGGTRHEFMNTKRDSTWIDSKTLPVWLVLPLLVTSRDVQEAASSFGTTPRSAFFKERGGFLTVL